MKTKTIAITAAILILISCGSGHSPTDETLSSLGLLPVNTDLETPSISFTDIDGESFTLDDFSGSVVFMNFWASWCPPCRAEMPSMARLNSELQNLDFEMIAINVGEAESLVTAFVEEYEVDVPVYFDPMGEAAGTFGISALPTTIILDRKGNVRAAISGGLEWDSPEMISMFKEWSK